VTEITIVTHGFDEAVTYLEGINVPMRLGAAVDDTVATLARFAAARTPVVTGAMRGAWRGVGGRLFIDPSAINPRSGAPVTDYAPSVAQRLGIMEAVWDEGEHVGYEAMEDWFSDI